jgi:ArsR family transcriptional regulator
LLKEQELVASRKEGQKVLYRMPTTAKDDPKTSIVANALQSAHLAKWYARDFRSLQKVLEERGLRSREFFNSQAVQNMPSPGQSWRALSHGLIRLIEGKRILDLGCGNGRLSINLAQSGNRVTGVDTSEEQIRLARELGSSATGNPVFLHVQMEETGLPSASFDLVIVSQSLHHAAKPKEAIAESFRLLVPGGRILILDLLAHGEEWMRTKFGDFWLGFSISDLESWLRESGFEKLHSEITGSTKDYPEIEGLLMQAEKP